MWLSAVIRGKGTGPGKVRSTAWIAGHSLKEADWLVGTACRRAAGLGSLRPGKPWECGRHGPRTRIPEPAGHSGMS